MNPVITWYSTSEDLTSIDHGAIEKDAALAVIDTYFAQLQPHYQSGETALAQSLLGFQKNEEDFIEICIHSPSDIDFKQEIITSTRILFFDATEVDEIEITLHSPNELKDRVAAFFDSIS